MEGHMPNKRGVVGHGNHSPICNVYALKIREIQLVTFLLTNLYPPDTISQTANTKAEIKCMLCFYWIKKFPYVCI